MQRRQLFPCAAPFLFFSLPHRPLGIAPFRVQLFPVHRGAAEAFKNIGQHRVVARFVVVLAQFGDNRLARHPTVDLVDLLAQFPLGNLAQITQLARHLALEPK